ncbi:MAG: rhodanese-like domain-containing protein [Candidatus Kapaibacteriales bacterium]
MRIYPKQIGKESFIIIVFALLISVVYNYFNPKGINIFEKPKFISDSLLDKIVLSIDSINNQATVHTGNKEDIKPKDNTASLNSDSMINLTHNETAKPIETKKPIEQMEEVSPMEITLPQMKNLLQKPNIVVIDARSSEEFEKGHINRAINIFAYEEDLERYFKNLTRVPIDNRKIIIVYCEGGTCEASHKVASDLIRLGHKNVFVYTGGWEEWSKEGN